jgi:ribosomal protein S8E
MSQVSKMKHSREQWKEKAKQHGKGERYERREKARIKAERDQLTRTLKASQTRVHELEAQLDGLAIRPKVDVVHFALQLFLEARISFRAVSRVLTLLARTLGIHKAPCAQTIINWVLRLTIVRIDAARTVRGLPLDPAPFSNGLLWMIDISIGLGSGKIVAVLALDAHHHQLESGAPTLRHVHCIGVAVANSWTGETIATLLKRLIAQMGRPAAYLKDNGSELHKAVALLADDGLDSPCLDDISHAAAGMLKRTYQHHPAFDRLLSACGRASGKLKHTLLACLAPPTVRTKARFMNVHRLVAWADRVLQLSPPGGAKRGSLLATLRSALDDLPACKTLIKRFQGDAGALLACQDLLKNRGLGTATVAQCEPLIDAMPTAAIGQEFRAYLTYQLGIATTLGLAQVGVPISSDAIESLFGVGKRHGVGETPDAARIALRLPALCGRPTREEAEQVLGVSVARQHECTATLPSLTQQRREVLAHPERLESLVRQPASPHVELIPSPKTRVNNEVSIDFKKIYRNKNGTPFGSLDESMVIENAGLPHCEQMALTS